MKNFKDIILEKLKVSSKSQGIFDDIYACDPYPSLINDTSHILYNNDYRSVEEYYDLKNIYGDDLPGFYRSESFCDKKSKCIGLYGESKDIYPHVCLIFVGHDNKTYSMKYASDDYYCLCRSLGKGDVYKGIGILRYIACELK